MSTALSALALIAGLTVPVSSASAQGMVQAIPPKETRDLSEALGRLARNPRDLSALIAAGDASLQVDDVDAAIGFFGRADDLSPGNPQVKAGLAGAYVRSGRPLEAMELFVEAQAAGGASGMMAADRGLAYDLIGDPARAQEEYARALAYRRSDEVLRRLALSQAISGDRRNFESTLRPLIAKRDFAAYRIRAFGLAILGEADEAAEIASAVMPGGTSSRMAPFFAVMPRLTAAQQASAANLGMFPSTDQIGRDDPQFAGFRSTSPDILMRQAETRLAPAGPAMGSQPAQAAQAAQAGRSAAGDQRRRPGRGAASAGTRRAANEAARRANRRAASDPMARTNRSLQASVVAVERPMEQQPTAAEPVEVAAAPVAQPTAPAPQPGFDLAQVSAPRASVATVPEPAPEPAPQAASPVVVASIGQTRELPTVANVQNPATLTLPSDNPAPAPGNPPAPAAPPPSSPQPAASVADSFGSFIVPRATSSAPSAAAVDITAIEPPREIEQPPVAEPAPPAHPSRIWVQVATGRDRSALRFDWRRFARQAPDVLGGNGPFVTPWGQANRLLAGPFSSQAEARRAVGALKEEGVDSFTFTSPQGQAIEPLG